MHPYSELIQYIMTLYIPSEHLQGHQECTANRCLAITRPSTAVAYFTPA